MFVIDIKFDSDFLVFLSMNLIFAGLISAVLFQKTKVKRQIQIINYRESFSIVNREVKQK